MIEVKQLTKRYGETTAVDDLSFTVRPGRVTGFLGPNGAGKTTTLSLLVGLSRPTRGTATIDGVPFDTHPRGLRYVGALLDARDVHGGRTGHDHLTALARSNGLGCNRVRQVLEEVGLADVAARRVGTYSLGMKQRLGIAAALLGDPPVLLFDEPLNGLDPEGVRWVRGLFHRKAHEGRTVLVSSHLMSEMEHTAIDLVVVGRGRLIAAETLVEFAARGRMPSVTVRTPDPTALSAALAEAGAKVTTQADGALAVQQMSARDIGDLALARFIPLHELSPQVPSLEEAFMKMTGGSVEYRAGRRQ
ncbi:MULTISPECIES: ABC transporter ATP-binding protein [Micromonospora]|uniref:ATP-binding cassette domain-containing protein n=1 Tax=Micromonospora antibiotica TaxID=2807623 RepID=A0ABS3VFM9_9ACTN|nr:ATP-binding cassette domain-containing protein [Micromonospora antibiotica]MBO4164431.1 ATP-binding cassette domain-containing protein [Micromonospora antibiotica]